MTVWTPQDRSISVAPGHRVVTGYVPIEQIIMACRARMAVSRPNLCVPTFFRF